ncbi:hypothetical protein H4R33_006203 [Dimargaris cristalligena]|uniref:Uncharacterized protein n=1 Tax=Dimargaris cristalligena TaxID=215637 RepID=A0A4V1J4Q5_9FUNG|nr:hypothetical protein H4R33_006203 [Dimargaris cristalligena]RKP36379.1 hypothetical protein BJ085DRAFT_30928 [Dimargaris cristalligena]|eukprot:RKP36379.1 hypothetical protein BJ085DRAFT_30928 [Dimargaris cristalligena]
MVQSTTNRLYACLIIGTLVWSSFLPCCRSQLIINDNSLSQIKPIHEVSFGLSAATNDQGQCPLDCSKAPDCRRCVFDTSESFYVAKEQKSNVVTLLSFPVPPIFDTPIVQSCYLKLPPATLGGNVTVYIAEARGEPPIRNNKPMNGLNAPQLGDIYGYFKAGDPIEVPVLSGCRTAVKYNAVSTADFYVTVLTDDVVVFPGKNSGQSAALRFKIDDDKDMNKVVF